MQVAKSIQKATHEFKLSKWYLPERLACLIVLSDSDTFNFTALLKMLRQHFLINAEVDILDETRALIRVVSLLRARKFPFFKVGVLSFGFFLDDGVLGYE